MGICKELKIIYLIKEIITMNANFPIKYRISSFCSNKKEARLKIKDYKDNKFYTLNKINAICHTIADSKGVSLAILINCEIIVDDTDTVVYCLFHCIFKNTKEFASGFIEMYFSLEHFENDKDAIIKIFEKTQEYR